MRAKCLCVVVTVILGVVVNQIELTPTEPKLGTISEELEDLSHRLSRLEMKFIRMVNTNSLLEDLEKKVKETERKTKQLANLERYFDENNNKLKKLMAKFPKSCHDLYQMNWNSVDLNNGPYTIYPGIYLILYYHILLSINTYLIVTF